MHCTTTFGIGLALSSAEEQRMNVKEKTGWVAILGIVIAVIIGVIVTPGYSSSINAFYLNDNGLVHPVKITDATEFPLTTPISSRPAALDEGNDADADIDASLYRSEERREIVDSYTSPVQVDR